MKKDISFSRLTWTMQKQQPASPLWIFCSWNTTDSPGEDGQGRGEGTRTVVALSDNSRGKKHPSCLLGKVRTCSSKFTKELFCGIIACHFCIITFWLKLLFRQGSRSKAWALLTLLSVCMVMKEAFEKSKIHISSTQCSPRKWIKEHGALNGLKNRTASDEFQFISSGVFLLLIFMVQNEGQCFTENTMKTAENHNAAENHNENNATSWPPFILHKSGITALLFQQGWTTLTHKCIQPPKDFFHWENEAHMFQPLSPAVLPYIPFLPKCDSFYSFRISFQLQILHRDFYLERIKMASTVGSILPKANQCFFEITATQITLAKGETP